MKQNGNIKLQEEQKEQNDNMTEVQVVDLIWK